MALNSDVADEEASLVYLKYGFDGTNSRSYQQIAKYSAAYSNSLFCTSLLPLQLVDKYTCIVYWSNPRPSSTRFCRPIKIAHEKETPETARNEEQDLQQQIEDLTDFKYKSCLISFEMHLTMIDGKTRFCKKLGILVDTPTQGAGNTNDGNMARKFFANTEIVS
uniref:Uncharacterized protein n=1 Tax=Trichogramma kaykai TaxID=54128 RepID=A0ABD2X790_9HYME